MLDRKISEMTFAVAWHGYADGPAQNLLKYLNDYRARSIITITHPLVKEGDVSHRIDRWERGTLRSSRSMRLPFRPPATYPIDMVVPHLPEAFVDLWFGFNNLNCLKGLLLRRMQRTKQVIYYCVDFTPGRFGQDTWVTGIYDRVDQLCCCRADQIWSLSQAMQKERIRVLGVINPAPRQVVPMGIWLDRVPSSEPGSFARRQIVFLGHLVPRMGVQKVIEALPRVIESLPDATLTIIGRGPFEENLRSRTEALKLSGHVRFLGFIESHVEIERIIAESALAVATYNPEEASFTWTTDPGKLKVYLGAGLPIVMTEVPPNSRELAEHGGARLVDYTPQDIGDAILEILSNEREWNRRSVLARSYARQFDWKDIFDRAFGNLFSIPPNAKQPA